MHLLSNRRQQRRRRRIGPNDDAHRTDEAKAWVVDRRRLLAQRRLTHVADDTDNRVLPRKVTLTMQ